MTDVDAQARLVTGLLDPHRFPPPVRTVRLVETHISWVLLAGRYAYKIKKAVNLGFLDFTTLESRRFFCGEEIRLNRRLAPRIYRDVISIGGSPEHPVLGGAPAIEYAVRMRRFGADTLMDALLAKGRATASHIDRLAGTLVRFHDSLPPAPAESPFATPARIRQDAQENFNDVRALLHDSRALRMLAAAGRATEAAYAACAARFEARRRAGRVRECHGDLHFGNIALLGDEPVPFDGIEFSPDLRWMDVMNEIAFPAMDLLYHRQPALAYRFVNAYLEGSGDYEGMSVLRFYIAYRAMVRAKISAIRARQPDVGTRNAEAEAVSCRRHIALALRCLKRQPAALIITHGLPGSGKTTFAQAALEQLGAIRIRSDVERKRLFGLAPLESSHAGMDEGIYKRQATERTYARLLELAQTILAASCHVIVDAAFLKGSERRAFRELAQRMGVPFIIAELNAPDATLRARLARRHSLAQDASEADAAVLDRLRAAQEPLSEEEAGCAIEFANEASSPRFDAQPGWRILCERVAGAR